MQELLETVESLESWRLLLIQDYDRCQAWMGPEPASATEPGEFPREQIGHFVLRGPSPPEETEGKSQVRDLYPFLCYVPDAQKQNRLHYYDSIYRYQETRKDVRCDGSGSPVRFEHSVPEGDEDLKLSCVTFSPNGGLLASASEGCIRIWDARTAREVASDDFFEGEPVEIAFAEACPLVVFTTGWALFLWDWQSSFSVRQIEEWSGEENGGEIAICSDASRFAIGRSVGKIDLWRVRAMPAKLRDLDGTVSDFRDYDAEKAASFEAHPERYVKAVRFIKGSTQFATTANDGTLKIWDVAEVAARRQEAHTGMITDLSFSPSGDFLASSSFDGSVRLWDAARGSMIHAHERHGVGATAARVSMDNSRVVTGWDDGSIEILEVPGYEKSRAAQVVGSVVSLEFGTSRDQVVAVSAAGWVQAWNVADGSLTALCAGNAHRTDLQEVVMALSEDGRFVTFSQVLSPMVHVWSFSPLQEVFSIAEGPVRALAFSSALGVLAIAKRDGTICLWDLSRNGRAGFARHAGANRLVFCSNSKRLISGTEAQFRTGVEGLDLVMMNMFAPSTAESRITFWDLGSAKCCESIEGYGDTTAFASSAARCRAVVRGGELVIQEVENGREVAWFPAAPRIVRTHPSCATWAGAVGSRLWIWRLGKTQPGD